MPEDSRGIMFRRPVLLGTVLIVIGLVLIVGGVELVLLGGSPYYLVAGLLTGASGVMLWRGSRLACWLYGLMLVGTIVWAFWESGPHGWALAPRILPPLVLGLWFLLPGVRNKLGPRRERPRAPVSASAVATVLVALVGLGAASLVARSLAQEPAPAPVAATPAVAGADWVNYGGTLAGQRFSGLAQITPANVAKLQVAWTFRTGDLPRAGEAAPREFTYEVTPLKIGDTLYLCTPHNQVIALDAETGKQRWRFDSRSQTDQAFVLACRGVSYVQTAAAGPCASRIVAATLDARLFELDARTGRLCQDFGDKGYVNLLTDMGQVLPGFHYETSPPTVVNGHIVLGGWINDNQSTDEPSGVIRSFDPVTGALQWAWDMGAPDRIGAPPPGQTYTRDTPNAWSVFAADPGLNLVYVPTGNAPPDFYGPNRRPFDEKYASSLVALDLSDGRPRWSFQTTHHDLWDYDVPAQPALVDIPLNGQLTPAVVQATKRGEIFVLDRRTGTPIFPVVEKPVPQGPAPGERLSPTQPFSAISFLPPKLTEAKMWGVTPIDQMICRIQFRQSRYEGIFTPQGLKPVIVFPGALGVVDWGSVAVDPDRKVLVANTSAVPYRDQLVPREKAPEGRTIEPTTVKGKGDKPQPGANYAWSPQVGTPYVMHTQPFMGPLGVPCTQPPWGFLRAVDLTSGKQVWKRPIGTAQDSGPKGIASHLPLLMGVPNLGGSMVTRSGLVFNGSTLDRYLRAYDARSGKQLWQARLPAGGQATPMTYLSPSGRQMVVIAAGGHQGMMTKIGDYIVAYALPAAAQ